MTISSSISLIEGERFFKISFIGGPMTSDVNLVSSILISAFLNAFLKHSKTSSEEFITVPSRSKIKFLKETDIKALLHKFFLLTVHQKHKANQYHPP